MRLSNFSDYSLRTLIYLGNQRDKLCNISEIADFYSISENHLMKVVHQLGMLGFIKTVRGKGGGISLGMEPKEINVGDVIRKMEAELALAECFTKDSQCRINDVCSLRAIFDEALDSLLAVLDRYTLADITKKPANVIRFYNKKLMNP